jgi:hypothetical protein
MKTLKEPVAGIQLDLKFLMYNKAFLNDLLSWLPAHGINTILIEYEDKFPYRKYPFLRSKDAFTPAELKAFLDKARANNLRIIPLVQSLSHMEFALEHPELLHLAEAPDIPTQICPSNSESVSFVIDLMQEVLEYHREDEFFHCGGDETWFLGTCGKCAAWKEEKGLVGMWAEHEKKILDFIVSQNKTPIIWDDIFWKDFDSIAKVDIPKETVLMCWNYNITSLQGKGKDSEDLEFGGAAHALKQVETYHKAGFKTIACPCCNWGQLFPRHRSSLANTQAWAQKVAASKMLGLINSSWACFHVPLQTQLLYFSATADAVKDPSIKIDAAWMRNWFENEFGAAVADLDQSFETIGSLWEIPMPGYGRSFSPLGYGMMNMVLHYPGRQPERRRRGAYPNDWNSIDFSAIYQKGISEIKKGNLQDVYARLDEILKDYPEAVAVFKELSDKAQKNRDIAEMYHVLSDYKYLSAKVFSFILRGDYDKGALLLNLEAQKGLLSGQLAKCYEKEGAARMLRAWWEPLYNAVHHSHKQACHG